MKPRSELKIGPFLSKTKSLGQILVKPCVHSVGHSFDPIFIKLCQNVHVYKNLGQNLKMGHARLKNRAFGQFLAKNCRVHSFDSVFMKPCQNVNLKKTVECTVLIQSS